MFKATITIQTEQPTGQAAERVTGQPTGEASGEVSGKFKKVVGALDGEMKRSEIQKNPGLKHDDYYRLNYIEPAMKTGFIEMTVGELIEWTAPE